MATDKKVTASQADPAQLEAAIEERVGPILAQVLRKISIDQIRAESGTLGDLDVAKVVLGDATIDKVILTGTSATLNGAQAFLQTVRMVLDLQFTLEWEVDLGWIGNWSGTENLGSLPFGLNLGNVSVPSLANINLSIPNVTVDNVQAVVNPINNLDLGGAKITKVMARDTDVPADGFSLVGLGLGSASIKNFSVPKTSTATATIEEFEPNSAIKLPGAEVSNLQIPSSQVENISTGGFNFLAQASARSLGVDLGILAVRIIVTPVVHLDVGSMIIQDVELSAMANRLNVQGIQVPVKIRGITVRDIILQTVKIGEISL